MPFKYTYATIGCFSALHKVKSKKHLVQSEALVIIEYHLSLCKQSKFIYHLNHLGKLESFSFSFYFFLHDITLNRLIFVNSVVNVYRLLLSKKALVL